MAGCIQRDPNRPLWKRALPDILCVALVLLVSGVGGALYLLKCTETIGNQYGQNPYWFEPCAMVAWGRGLSMCVDRSEVPGFDDFLLQKNPKLAVDKSILRGLRVVKVSPFLRCHCYLLYGVGLTWRLLGISWDGVKIFEAFLYAMTAAVAFGLLRLGMNRLISLLGTAVFMLSPPLLVVLPSLRDFGKVPFILGAVLIMAFLIKNRVAGRQLWLMAGLLGIVIGIGLGFRQDLLVPVPAAAAVLLLCARGRERLAIKERGLAVVAFLVCFLAAGWPILAAMQAGIDRNTAHSLLQGWAVCSLDDIGLERASYDVLTTNDDFFVYATVSGYDYRTRADKAPENRDIAVGYARGLLLAEAAIETPFRPLLSLWRYMAYECVKPSLQEGYKPRMYSEGIELAGRRLWGEVIHRFPANLVTRWMGAMVRVLRTVDGGSGRFSNAVNPVLDRIGEILRPFRVHLDKYGCLYAAAAAVLISLRSVPLATFTFLLFAYFCGYTSLLFQARHAFHLEVFSIWFLGFLVQQAVSVVRVIFSHGPVELFQIMWRGRKEWVFVPARRAAAFVLIASLLTAFPVWAARVYQKTQIEHLLRKYASVDLEPLSVEDRQINGRQVFCPIDGLEPQPRATAFPWLPWVNGIGKASGWRDAARGAYLMAEFETSSLDCQLWFQYQGEEIRQFTTLFRPCIDRRNEPVVVRLFFPVYEIAESLRIGRLRFTGFGLSGAGGETFRGLYRVRNADDFSMWLNLALPSDMTRFRPFLTMPQIIPWWPAKES